MFVNVEEKIEEIHFKNSKCSKRSFESAQRILDSYKEISISITSDDDIQNQYRNININDEKAIEEIALLVTIACHRSLGCEWEIPGETIIWNIIPRINQIAGGIELCHIKDKNLFARQRTGEGKTVTLLFSVAFFAKLGNVHVMTANDYLAKRDQMWVGPVLKLLGIESSFLTENENLKKAIYSKRVVYGSDKEFTFDYLRDSIRKPGEDLLCEKRDYVIIDEADHILLDELTTPIVLSQSIIQSNNDIVNADGVVKELIEEQHAFIKNLFEDIKNEYGKQNDKYIEKIISLRYSGISNDEIKLFLNKNHKLVDKSEKSEMILLQDCMLEDICKDLYYIVDLQSGISYYTEKGLKHIEDKYLNRRIFTIPDYKKIAGRINKTKFEDLYKSRMLNNLGYRELKQYSLIKSYILSLQAHTLLFKDRDYIIKNGQVELITKSIGRSDNLKRFNDDLSLAVELKEGVMLRSKTRVVASTMLPHFISLYKKFAALSGTLFPDNDEFCQMYKARAFNVPAFKEVIAWHKPGNIYENQKFKHEALLDSIKKSYSFARPILIGTTSVEYSEEISELLLNEGLSHKVLNARNEFEEADIISQAGENGSIIIATNIAGRGTDIKVDDSVNVVVCENYVKKITEYINEDRTIEISCYSKFETELLLSYLCEFDFKISKRGNNSKIIINSNNGKNIVSIDFNLGLHVIVAEVFISRRIENQLRGRTGRQGAPGLSELFISLEDEKLCNIKSSVSFIRKILFGKFKFLNRNQNIHNYLIQMVNRVNEGEEKENRKNRIFYDNITERHRKKITEYRNELINEPIDKFVIRLIREFTDEVLTDTQKKGIDDQVKYLKGILKNTFDVIPQFLDKELVWENELSSNLKDFMVNHFYKYEKIYKKSNVEIKEICCTIIDEFWTLYLEEIDIIKEQSTRSVYLGKESKVYYLNLISDFLDDLLYEFRHVVLITVFNKLNENKRYYSSALRKSDLEDEISELIL